MNKPFSWMLPVVMTAGLLHTFLEQVNDFLCMRQGGGVMFSMQQKLQTTTVRQSITPVPKMGILSFIKIDSCGVVSPTPLATFVCGWVPMCVVVRGQPPFSFLRALAHYT